MSRFSFISQTKECCSVRILCHADALHIALPALLYAEDEPTQSNVAFGTSFLNRPTFPHDIAHDYFGNSQTPLRGVATM